MQNSKIYERARAIWGDAHQIEKAKEECLEFVLACSQYEQRRLPIEDVIEELADVIITSGQARLILGPEAVDQAIDRKLTRLVEKMSAVPMTQKKREN